MPWVNYPFKFEKTYRRPGWDYSSNGYYFITICTKDRINLFRNMVGTDLPARSLNNKNIDSLNKKYQTIGDLNQIGQMVEKWWYEIPNKYKNIDIDKFIIMPNHFHGILIIKNSPHFMEEQTHRSVPTIDQNIFGYVQLLGHSIQWFKTMTTNEYIKNVKQNNWPKFNKQLWQSRYNDRIIRSEKEYWAKRIYIENNPKNWGKNKDDLM